MNETGVPFDLGVNGFDHETFQRPQYETPSPRTLVVGSSVLEIWGTFQLKIGKINPVVIIIIVKLTLEIPELVKSPMRSLHV